MMKKSIYTLLLLLGSASVPGSVKSDEFDEFHRDNDEISLISCTHDAAPRFGKRICDCGYRNEQYTVPQFEGSTTEIEIANCKTLRIRRDTFSALFQLTKLTIVNVEDLILESNSLDFSRNDRSAQLKIFLTNDVIEEVSSHLISGHVAEVTFLRCRIGVFRPYSITSIREQLESMNILRSFVNRIERHAFKRFDVSQLTIEESKFIAPIPSQSFYEIEVINRFVISNCSFYAVLPSGFVMKNVTNFLLRYNEFEKLSGDSMNMQIRNSIRIVGNYFNKIDPVAFRSTSLDSSYYSRHSEKPTLLFHNNRISYLEDARSLSFSNEFNIELREIYIEQNIDCGETSALKQTSLLMNHSNYVFFGSKGSFQSLNDIRQIRCMEDSFWLHLTIEAEKTPTKHSGTRTPDVS
ncbi:uncharacterized protein LOC129718293 isoform X2 [Wyeomyia smithii]|uniref:uncharacterized protein LOC129718293 isoform X2 n=1 Tax=Wyeomyia smithii TaxID=174621 RepID=UPI002467BFC0|nr:uncharacterized protein LOC129718293 isoform X2 [Wyeomyia smithii]